MEKNIQFIHFTLYTCDVLVAQVQEFIFKIKNDFWSILEKN